MLPENHNDLRSDTFTTPTKEMLALVSSASIGDSVYNEDSDTLALEKKVAAMTGHEAGLFCVSGTLSNQIALRTHLHQPPHSILCDHRSHVYVYEAGGLATLSQAMVTPVHAANGKYLTLEDVIKNIIVDNGNIHSAPTRVVSLENTLNGVIMPLEEIKRISAWCRSNGIRIHCDGARIWDASLASGVSLEQYGELFDSISLCLSKGMGAPIGSILVGSKEFILKANHFKKQNGGGIRQSGMLTRMASYAIDNNFPLMSKAHEKAQSVAKFAVEELGLQLEVPADTNFVFLDIAKNKINVPKMIASGEKYGVKLMGGRLAFCFQTSDETVENVKKVLTEVKQQCENEPFEPEGAILIYQGERK